METVYDVQNKQDGEILDTESPSIINLEILPQRRRKNDHLTELQRLDVLRIGYRRNRVTHENSPRYTGIAPPHKQQRC